MWEVDALIDLDPASPAPAQRGAGEIAEAIDGKTGGFFEAGEEDGGSEMGEVMLDVMDLGFELEAVGLLERSPRRRRRSECSGSSAR